MQQLGDLRTYLLALRPANVLDILLVATIIYALLYVVRGTRAIQLLRGVLLLILAYFFFDQVLNLQAFRFLVELILPALLISIPVVFQPELRRALERLGRAGLFIGRSVDADAADSVVTVVSLAARELSAKRWGALIVIERDTGLDDLAERGVSLDAVVSVDLLTQIFYPKTPMHDGAVIVRAGRVVAARVVLPLSEHLQEMPGLGTRHLAACSVTENSDALAVVVSEETGTISLAKDGSLTRHLDEGTLSRRLLRELRERQSTGRLLGPLRRVRDTGLVRRMAEGIADLSSAADGEADGAPPEAAAQHDPDPAEAAHEPAAGEGAR